MNIRQDLLEDSRNKVFSGMLVTDYLNMHVLHYFRACELLAIAPTGLEDINLTKIMSYGED